MMCFVSEVVRLGAKTRGPWRVVVEGGAGKQGHARSLE